MHAIDKDYGRNALVSYTFSEGTGPEVKELFDINRQTGEVFTKRDLTEQGRLKMSIPCFHALLYLIFLRTL